MKGIFLAGAASAVMGLWACDGDDTGGAGTTGSSGSTSSGGSSADLIERYCDGIIARAELCGSTPMDLTACLANGPCLVDLVRPEIIEDLVTCLIEADCSTSNDSCWYHTGAASPTAGQEDFSTACQAKDAACTTGVKDDYCFFTAGTTERYEAMSACLALPCEQVNDCFEASAPQSCQD